MLGRLRATPDGDPRLAGDDHRLLAAARRPAQAARARPRDAAASASRRSTSSASCRSSRPRRATRSWSRTCAYLERVTHDPGPNVVFASATGDPRRARRRVAAATTRGTAPRSKNIRRADRADGQLDHDRRPARDQPDRGGVRARPRGRGDGALRRGRASPSAATSSRRWPRSARRCATIGAFLWSEAAIVLAARARARGAARLAARGDARRDAPARVRPAARPPRRAVGVPRRARPRRRSAGAVLAAAVSAVAHPPAAARGDTPGGVSEPARPDRRGRPRAARRCSSAASRRRAFGRTAVSTGAELLERVDALAPDALHRRHRPPRRRRPRRLPGAAQPRRPVAGSLPDRARRPRRPDLGLRRRRRRLRHEAVRLRRAGRAAAGAPAPRQAPTARSRRPACASTRSTHAVSSRSETVGADARPSSGCSRACSPAPARRCAGAT